MAKFARVGYGHDGRGVGKFAEEGGYIYVVNDNVRTHDVIQPIAHNYKSGKAFVTTGMVNHAYKENSVKGREQQVDVLSKSNKDIGEQIKKTLSGEDIKDLAKENTIKVYGSKELGTGKSQEDIRTFQVQQYMQKTPFEELTKNTAEKYNAGLTNKAYSKTYGAYEDYDTYTSKGRKQ